MPSTFSAPAGVPTCVDEVAACERPNAGKLIRPNDTTAAPPRCHAATDTSDVDPWPMLRRLPRRLSRSPGEGGGEGGADDDGEGNGLAGPSLVQVASAKSPTAKATTPPPPDATERAARPPPARAATDAARATAAAVASAMANARRPAPSAAVECA